jgi:SNF2 family DNA or RNA helicase
MTIHVFHDKQHNVLLYDTPTPLDIARVVPNSFTIHGGYVGVPVSLPNLQRLRTINYPVIAPMEQHYDWPIEPGRKPWIAQRAVANFFALNPRSFCLSEMRTGKTLASLWAADYIMSQYPRGTCRTIIVATLKTLRRTWGETIFNNFLGRRRHVVLHGTAEERAKLLDADVDYYIINHDGLGTGYSDARRKVELTGFAAKLMARQDIRICIVDECSAYRNHTTKRWQVMKHLLAWREYLWMMSGTPTPQGPEDAYGQAKLVNNAYGESKTAYKMRVMQQISQFKWVPRQGASEEAKKLLSPAIRFTQADCFEVGPVTVYQEDAELSGEQKKQFKQMKTDLQLTMKKGERIDAVNEAALRMKLLQISCGAIYDSGHNVHLIDNAPRIAVLKECVEEAPRKVIIFAPLTSVLHMLQKHFPKSAVLNGETSTKESDEILRRFQNTNEINPLIAHPGPIARGLDLTAAATIIWYAPTDKTEDYIQANERINGPAQKFPRTIVQIAATSIEREIYKRLETNQGMQGIILKLAENGI